MITLNDILIKNSLRDTSIYKEVFRDKFTNNFIREDTLHWFPTLSYMQQNGIKPIGCCYCNHDMVIITKRKINDNGITIFRYDAFVQTCTDRWFGIALINKKPFGVIDGYAIKDYKSTDIYEVLLSFTK